MENSGYKVVRETKTGDRIEIEFPTLEEAEKNFEGNGAPPFRKVFLMKCGDPDLVLKAEFWVGTDEEEDSALAAKELEKNFKGTEAMPSVVKEARRRLALEVARIARVAHEMNKRWCELVGDQSQVSWNQAPEWQRQSAIAGVNRFIQNPNITAEALHESWMRQKLADGWKRGPVKDVEKKEHPCLVSYDLLPAIDRAKDEIFRACVKALYADC